MTVKYQHLMLDEQENSVADTWHTVCTKTDTVPSGQYKLIVSGDVTLSNKNSKGSFRLRVDSVSKRDKVFTVDAANDWTDLNWSSYFNVPVDGEHTVDIQGAFTGSGSIKCKELNILLEKY